jgi:hypothetical protein
VIALTIFCPTCGGALTAQLAREQVSKPTPSWTCPYCLRHHQNYYGEHLLWVVKHEKNPLMKH